MLCAYRLNPATPLLCLFFCLGLGVKMSVDRGLLLSCAMCHYWPKPLYFAVLDRKVLGGSRLFKDSRATCCRIFGLFPVFVLVALTELLAVCANNRTVMTLTSHLVLKYFHSAADN